MVKIQLNNMSFLCCCCPYSHVRLPTQKKLMEKGSKILPKEGISIKAKEDRQFVFMKYGALSDNISNLKIPSNILRNSISKLVCGVNHMVLLANNHVLVSGDNTYFQCGPALKRSFNILKISSPIDIAAGSYSTLVLSRVKTSTVIYAFGHESSCGFEGHKQNPVQISIPEVSLKSIHAGSYKAGAIDDSGRLYVWGAWNSSKNRAVPKHLEVPESVEKVEFGKDFALILSRKGKLYVIGDNSYGELGLGKNVMHANKPTIIPHFRSMQVLDIATGDRHSLVLEGQGRVFCFGDNSEGQCTTESLRVYEPIEIHSRGHLSDKNIITRFVWAGQAHSALLTNQGELYMWGDNTASRLGSSGSQSIRLPTLPEETLGRCISQVALGGVFTIVVLGSRRFSLLNSGRNQLARQSKFMLEINYNTTLE